MQNAYRFLDCKIFLFASSCVIKLHCGEARYDHRDENLSTVSFLSHCSLSKKRAKLPYFSEDRNRVIWAGKRDTTMLLKRWRTNHKKDSSLDLGRIPGLEQNQLLLRTNQSKSDKIRKTLVHYKRVIIC